MRLMPYECDLSNYQPEFVKDFKEFSKIAETENGAFNSLWQCFSDVLENTCFQTLNEDGIKRWEEILSLTVKSSYTYSDRKMNIIAKINRVVPFTFKKLLEILDNLCGKGSYEVVLSYEEYSLSVFLELTEKNKFDIVKSTISEIIPANILLEVFLRYNTHKDLKAFTNGQLSGKTHINLKEEYLKNG